MYAYSGSIKKIRNKTRMYCGCLRKYDIQN